MKIKHLFPILAAKDLERTIEFYEKYLGFECLGKYPAENPCWTSLCKGDAEIAFSVPEDQRSFEKTEAYCTIYLVVENVDEVYENLREKVEITYPVKNFDYGMREFGIRDCNGYILHLGENIE